MYILFNASSLKGWVEELQSILPKIFLLLALSVASVLAGCDTQRRNIMLTGYWPPTNQMLVQFSTDKNLNPDGWKGKNWRGLGYDVHSYFPTFPNGLRERPEGQGDFRVDYQATRLDFGRLTGWLCPEIIISFGQGAGPWEIEYNAVNATQWTDDFVAPVQMSKLPPEQVAPAGYKRHSTLPVQAIADAVNEEQIGVHAWVDWEGDPGTFLCNYIAYLNALYKTYHNDPDDPCNCRASGFIHVSADLPVDKAVKAVEITLETTIEHVKSAQNLQAGS